LLKKNGQNLIFSDFPKQYFNDQASICVRIDGVFSLPLVGWSLAFHLMNKKKGEKNE
jgi:hypothetical protein